jgi:addiction module RelE/StbE family toxin
MKKNILISAFLCLSFSFVFGQIAFENNHTLDMLKAKAKKEKKLIFIDAYTTWCGPCKWISANIFTDKDVATFYNKNFINAKFDMEDQGEGTKIGSLYKVMCYPNLLFIDADGKLVHRTSGAEQDRLEIFEFIARDNPLAAVRMDELFGRSAARLAEQALLGRPGVVAGTRELIVHESYRLVYELDGDVVWILTLVHTAQLWPKG